MAAPEIAKRDQRAGKRSKGPRWHFNGRGEGKKKKEAARKLLCLLLFSPLPGLRILSFRSLLRPLDGGRDREREWGTLFRSQFYMAACVIWVILTQRHCRWFWSWEEFSSFLYLTFYRLDCEWNVWLNKKFDDRKCETDSFERCLYFCFWMLHSGQPCKCLPPLFVRSSFCSSSWFGEHLVKAQLYKIRISIRSVEPLKWKKRQHSHHCFHINFLFYQKPAGSRFVLVHWYCIRMSTGWFDANAKSLIHGHLLQSSWHVTLLSFGLGIQ